MGAEGPRDESAARAAAEATYEVMDPSAPFEHGFNWKTIAAALFVGFVMMPSSMLISMTTGAGIGTAADWITVILFIEVARRALVKLKTQEVLIIYWIAAGLMASSGYGLAGGGPFGQWIWNQYLIQSPQAMGIRQWVPDWVVPSPERYPDVYAARTFFHRAWLYPLVVMLAGLVLGTVNNTAAGYVLFRLTSDVEKLPFPLAKIHAFGATALAESSQGTETWRWRMFSAGAMVGIAWGALYIGIPVVGGLFWDPPPMLIKIPFWDLTHVLTNMGLCAVPLALSINVGAFMAGWVIPWRVVLGVFIGTCVTFVAFPIMYSHGLLPHWENGFGALATNMMNGIDFTISFHIGTAVVVALVGVGGTVWKLRQQLRRTRGEAAPGSESKNQSTGPPPGRGDVPMWAGVAIWAGSILAMVMFSAYLVNHNLGFGELGVGIYILLIFGFLYSPLVQYANARMVGVMGSGQIHFPYARQAGIYLSGARGARIWFVPFFMREQAPVETFKQLELTRTKFTSYYKMVAASLIIIFIFSGLYWAILWKMGDIPSSAYPYVKRMWPFQAIGQIMWVKTTLPTEPGTESIFATFLHPRTVLAGFVIGIAVLLLLKIFRASTLLFYGLVGALGSQAIISAIPMFVGAVLSRFVIARRIGREKWGAYAPLITAGYGAGFGLAGLFCVGFSLMWKAATG